MEEPTGSYAPIEYIDLDNLRFDGVYLANPVGSESLVSVLHAWLPKGKYS